MSTKLKKTTSDSEPTVHANWEDANYEEIQRMEIMRKNALPLNTTGGTYGRSLAVHNVNWEGRELVSVVVVTGMGRRVPCGFTYKEALEIASRLISAAKITQERLKEAGRV